MQLRSGKLCSVAVPSLAPSRFAVLQTAAPSLIAAAASPHLNLNKNKRKIHLENKQIIRTNESSINNFPAGACCRVRLCSGDYCRRKCWPHYCLSAVGKKLQVGARVSVTWRFTS